MKTTRHSPILTIALVMATALPLAAQQGARGDRNGSGEGVAAQRGMQGQQARGARQGVGDRGQQARDARGQGSRDARGQGARGARQGGADRGMQGIERILGLSTVLELTDAQVQNLNALRVQGLERREAQRGAMARIRSDLAAGQVTREEARERMEALRSENPRNTAAQPVQELLTEEQRTKLQELVRSGRRGELQGQGGRRGGGAAATPGGERGRRR